MKKVVALWWPIRYEEWDLDDWTARVFNIFVVAGEARRSIADQPLVELRTPIDVRDLGALKMRQLHVGPGLRTRVRLYAALVLGWVAFARWMVPPLLVAERPGPLIEALKRFLQAPPVPFLVQDTPGQWREFSGAVLIALVLYLTIVEILGRYDRRAHAGGSSSESRAAAHSSLALAIVAAAFLAVTILSGARRIISSTSRSGTRCATGRTPGSKSPGSMDWRL